eukprot:CAMPEP_0184482384 /NCGR_PEP_ID=MMETSP0113_2-20130426/3947_1 /TAXON_ID=91329 /ORGANISM="Norrisiella sphaerica, Strain BC52" /LENGTH=378 /DNA_ID=CAMNT_0026862079 /DNA_START=117 /DNA_END=1253 /DNA_ORIENTATION=-
MRRSLLSVALLATTVSSCWKEQNGVIMIEAESTNWEVARSDGWEKLSKNGETVLGFRKNVGSRKIVSTGSTKGFCYNNIEFTGSGNYWFEIRNINSNGVEHNDVWADFVGLTWKGQRLRGGSRKTLGSGYIKVFRNQKPGTLRWDSYNTDFNAHRIFVDIPRPGSYKVCLKGRSTKFFIDKLVFYKQSVSSSSAHSRSETKCGGKSPAPVPAPKKDKAPAPAPAPAPKKDKAPAPAPAPPAPAPDNAPAPTPSSGFGANGQCPQDTPRQSKAYCKTLSSGDVVVAYAIPKKYNKAKKFCERKKGGKLFTLNKKESNEVSEIAELAVQRSKLDCKKSPASCGVFVSGKKRNKCQVYNTKGGGLSTVNCGQKAAAFFCTI